MTNREFLCVWKKDMLRITTPPGDFYRRLRSEGNNFPGEWVEKGEAERRAKKKER